MPNDVIIGRHPASAELDYAVASGGTLIANVFERTLKHVWITSFRFQGGRAGASSPVARAALYLASQNGPPAQRLGYSEQVTLSTLKSDAASGAFYTPAVSLSDDGPSNLSIPVPSGSYVGLALLITGATAHLGMMAASRIDGLDEAFYQRFGLSQPPPSAFGSASSSIEGNLTLAAIGDSNEAPVAPNNRTPSSTIESTTPTLAGDHRDRNSAYGGLSGSNDVGDYLKQYQTQVRRVSDGAVMWAPAARTATPEERASGRFQAPYLGDTLVRGVAYEWRCRTSDHFSAWGPWSDWLAFTPANLGFVELNGYPLSTIQEDDPDFDYTWTHQSSLSTNAVQLRLYHGDTLVATTNEIAATTAHNATGTLTWAASGLGSLYTTGLYWGTTYKYAIRGRDTNGVWSDWSARRQFRTNAPPGIPDGLSPSNGEILTSRPLLTALATDADDTPATGLLVTFRIKNDAGTVLFTRTATYNALTGLFEYQTTSTDLATFGDYRVDAYSYDGTLYSGARTLEANAVTSAEEAFTYANGPTVTITSPAPSAVIDTSTPEIHWTASAQNRYRVRAYPAGGAVPIYERGPLVSAATSWQIPAGYLRNLTAYDIKVMVEDATPLQGISERVAITTDYTPPPTPTGFSATPIKVRRDTAPTAILLQMEPSTEPSGTFVGRFIYRDDLTDPLVVLKSPDDTSFIDYEPTSGVEYTYTLRDVAQRDLDQVESVAVEAAAMVVIQGVVLASTLQPERYRVTARGYRDRNFSRKVDEAVYTPWGAGKPRTYRRRARWWEGKVTLRLVDDAGVPFLVQLDDLREMDERNHTICYRDSLKRKFYITITDIVENDQQARSCDVDVSMREEQHQVGQPQ